MSWSIELIGKPENLVVALDKHSESLSGPSKEEFDAVLPHAKGIIQQNYGPHAQLLRVKGYGSGYKPTPETEHRSCMLSVEPVVGQLV